MPNRPVIEILRAHDPLSARQAGARAPVSAERETARRRRGPRRRAHDAQHTYPGHRTHEEHGHESGALRNNGHGGDAGHARHGGHGGHGKHAGHSVEMFRRRFWLSLLLTVPMVVTATWSWTGSATRSTSRAWPGSARCSARSCSSRAAGRSSPARWREVRDRAAGDDAADRDGDHGRVRARRWPPTLGWFDLDFWWELAALVTIMLLGHWLEMKAIGQAQGALAALAALLPDEAERVDGDGDVETVPRRRRCASATSCWCAPAAGCPPTATIVDGEAELDESMITGESRPVAKRVGRPGRRRHGVDRLGDPGPGRRGRRRHRAGRHPAPGRRGAGSRSRGPRRSPTGSPRCCSTSPPAPRSSRSSSGARSATLDEAVEQHGHRAGHRLPARARAGDPAGDRAVDRGRGPRRHPGQGPPRARADAHRSTPCCSTRPAPSPRASTPSPASPPSTASPTTRCCASPAAVEADSEHPLARAIVAAAEQQAATPRAPRASGR